MIGGLADRWGNYFEFYYVTTVDWACIREGKEAEQLALNTMTRHHQELQHTANEGRKGWVGDGEERQGEVTWVCLHCRTGGEEVRLMLWDTAGQEEFDAITKAYYRGAQACVVAFSTTDRDSFSAVRKWKKKVRERSWV